MLSIVLGYRSHHRNATPEPLYLGADRGEAKTVMTAPPAGIVRTVLIANPPVQKRYVVPDSDDAPAVADPAPPKRGRGRPRKSEAAEAAEAAGTEGGDDTAESETDAAETADESAAEE